MKLNKKNPFILIVILILLFVIPLTVWLALNRQLLFRRAVEDTVTINLVPISIEPNLGENFAFDIYINADALKISGATISLKPSNPELINVMDIQADISQSDLEMPFTEMIYDKNKDPYTFTVLSKRADNELPTGSFRVASITLQSTGPGESSIQIDTTSSEVVGVKTGSEVTNFAISGTTAKITPIGQLCRIDACTDKELIDLVEQPRDDRRFDILVSWAVPANIPDSNPLYFYKVYRSIGEPLSTPHPDSNLVATTTSYQSTIIDTNKSEGYEGKSQVYYDIDTYIVCPDSIALTPTQAITETPTVTSTPTATPVSELPTNTPTPTSVPAANPLTLSATSGTPDTSGMCHFTLGWDFSGYENANPRITVQAIYEGIGIPQEIFCSQVTGCQALGNPISRITAPGILTYKFWILNNDVVQTTTYTCNSL